MTFKELLTEERAVSPVIGVILMVAITVILAAVIGTFVIGLGEGVGDTAPQASVDVTNESGNVTFTHRSGDGISYDNLNVVTGNTDSPFNSTVYNISGSQFTAGSTISINDSKYSSGDTVTLVYNDGEQSTTIASIEIE